MFTIKNDNRIVLTLDAGGTNMVFAAIKGGEYVCEPLTLASNASELESCLNTMVAGFRMIIENLEEKGEDKPVAISFAFPGPADYPNGIIGGYLPNFPSFRDGVALGPFLLEKFGLPVFINNDGDLYAYGEALGGVLPEINRRLREYGCVKQFKNLIGYTFGTGFGIGTVIDGQLNRGDNSCVETYCLKHPKLDNIIVEDGVAVRAIKRVYGELSGNPNHDLEPKDIAAISNGEKVGNKEAAIASFNELGEVAGDAMATAVTLIDGLIVIGGGIMNNYKHIMPGILKSLKSKIKTLSGDEINRVQMEVYNLDNTEEFEAFAKGDAREIKVFGANKTVIYDPQKRIGIVRSKIGASKAIALGAYAFALTELDK